MTAMIVALSLTAAPADPPKELSEAAKKELKKFEGKWKAEKVTSSEGEITPPDGEGMLEIKDRKILLDGKSFGEITELDPSVDPKCLDFKVLVGKGALSEGTVIETIYKIDGDTLTWAVYLGADKKRPANFDAPKEAGTFVVVLKRVKE
ncbi:MAG TPA: TIGR03067 domain-containing protein [Gemmataceae bacterium]|nr:TIGR03067 domain-containing protein [Gemmataceae bacterium]